MKLKMELQSSAICPCEDMTESWQALLSFGASDQLSVFDINFYSATTGDI